VEEGTKDNTDSGGINAESAGEKIDAKNRAKIVKQWSNGGDKETAMRLKNTGEEGRIVKSI